MTELTDQETTVIGKTVCDSQFSKGGGTPCHAGCQEADSARGKHGPELLL